MGAYVLFAMYLLDASTSPYTRKVSLIDLTVFDISSNG